MKEILTIDAASAAAIDSGDLPAGAVAIHCDVCGILFATTEYSIADGGNEDEGVVLMDDCPKCGHLLTVALGEGT